MQLKTGVTVIEVLAKSICNLLYPRKGAESSQESPAVRTLQPTTFTILAGSKAALKNFFVIRLYHLQVDIMCATQTN